MSKLKVRIMKLEPVRVASVYGFGPKPECEVEIKDFPGGLYAVTRCEVSGNPSETIPATWKQLILWSEESKYRRASHQWLEEHVQIKDLMAGEFVLDLYLPIAE